MSDMPKAVLVHQIGELPQVELPVARVVESLEGVLYGRRAPGVLRCKLQREEEELVLRDASIAVSVGEREHFLQSFIRGLQPQILGDDGHELVKV